MNTNFSSNFSAPPPVSRNEIKNKKSNKPVIIFIIIIILLGLGYLGYHFGGSNLISKITTTEVNVNKDSNTENTTDGSGSDETRQLVDKVGKLILLPEGETPTIATVSDPDKLRDQPFFAQATIGDKVLIYSKAKKAFLYNPNKNIIVEVAPLNIDSTKN